VSIEGKDLAGLGAAGQDAFRNRRMGFVFQFHYLLAELSALENVLMPARKAGERARRRPRAEALLRRFDLGGGMHRLPRQLSGGEQQRVAIARALVMEPDYLFADEPTGSLDSGNGAAVMDIIRDCNRTAGTTVVLVTHEADFAAQAGRCLHMVDGTLRDVGAPAPPPGSAGRA
jgi:putative ABC transport system ATP-binding protein/lipoprotein-releasing system ATP-binding protein